MTRQRSAERDADFERELRFTIEFSRFLDSLPRSPTTTVGHGQPDGTIVYREIPTPEVRVAPTMERFAKEAAGKKRKPRSALRIALQDLLEWSRSLTPEQRIHADSWLRDKGLPTLSAMSSEIWQTIPKLLERGRIRTDVEYYLLIERLNDFSDSGLTEEQRERLSQMVISYESARRSG
jgi:hypothetical protein